MLATAQGRDGGHTPRSVGSDYCRQDLASSGNNLDRVACRAFTADCRRRVIGNAIALNTTVRSGIQLRRQPTQLGVDGDGYCRHRALIAGRVGFLNRKVLRAAFRQSSRRRNTPSAIGLDGCRQNLAGRADNLDGIARLAFTTDRGRGIVRDAIAFDTTIRSRIKLRDGFARWRGIDDRFGDYAAKITCRPGITCRVLDQGGCGVAAERQSRADSNTKAAIRLHDSGQRLRVTSAVGNRNGDTATRCRIGFTCDGWHLAKAIVWRRQADVDRHWRSGSASCSTATAGSTGIASRTSRATSSASITTSSASPA